MASIGNLSGIWAMRVGINVTKARAARLRQSPPHTPKFLGPRKARPPSNFIALRPDTLTRLFTLMRQAAVEMLAEGLALSPRAARLAGIDSPFCAAVA
jgi:hypothetical protein